MLIKVIKIDINNKTKKDIDEELLHLFRRIAGLAAELEGYENGELSIALVNNQEIQQLNKKYREVDEPTDVLSFPMDEEVWGDVIISMNRVQEQAEEYGHSITREACYLVIHGVLHLLGYDHHSQEEKAKMRQHEERILSDLNIDRK